MAEQSVLVSSTYVEFTHNYGKINGYDIRNYVRRRLTTKEWIQWKRTFEIKGRFYKLLPDGRIRVHIGHFEEIKQEMGPAIFESLKLIEDTKPNKVSRPMKVKLKRTSKDKNEDQTAAINHATLPKTNKRCVLQLQTGGGKTYCSIKSAIKLGKPTLIVCRANQVDEWVGSLKTFTDVGGKDVYLIKGPKFINRLGDPEFIKEFSPSFFVVSTRTLTSIFKGNYTGLQDFEKFLDDWGIDTKIFDECHLEFKVLNKLELCSNTTHNIYLSATLGRSDSGENSIFRRMFPKHIVHEGPYHKYCDIFTYSYRLPSIPDQKVYTTPQGYSSSKYENWILSNPVILSYYLQVFLMDVFEDHYTKVRKKKQKVLILAATQNMVAAIVKFIENRYRDLNVKTKIEGDPLSNLADGVDAIISTPMSCGTGTDIKNLKTAINTCSVGSDNLTEQMLGRLRTLDGDTPIYIDIWNLDLEKHRNHADNRISIYLKRGASLTQQRR